MARGQGALNQFAEATQIPPAMVSNPSDNLKNLFEVPVLFYALALCSKQVDAQYLTAAPGYS
jgi:hypothetical protein